MQIQKDEVRQKILASATEEFYNKDYRNASLRNIAATAGITPGNIYRYFKNKDDLYNAVVEPAWNSIYSLFTYNSIAYSHLTTKSLIEISTEIGSVFITNKKHFFILIKNDSNAPGKNIRNILQDLINAQITADFQKATSKKNIDPTFLNIISIAIVEAMIYIFQNSSEDEKKMKMLLYKTIELFLNNLQKILTDNDLSC